jgi:hypothetical protein
MSLPGASLFSSFGNSFSASHSLGWPFFFWFRDLWCAIYPAMQVVYLANPATQQKTTFRHSREGGNPC